MAKIEALRSTRVGPQAILARAMEDLPVEGYDQVVIIMGGPTDTDARWSHMPFKDLVYLHRALGLAIDEAIRDGPIEAKKDAD